MVTYVSVIGALVVFGCAGIQVEGSPLPWEQITITGTSISVQDDNKILTGSLDAELPVFFEKLDLDQGAVLSSRQKLIKVKNGILVKNGGQLNMRDSTITVTGTDITEEIARIKIATDGRLQINNGVTTVMNFDGVTEERIADKKSYAALYYEERKTFQESSGVIAASIRISDSTFEVVQKFAPIEYSSVSDFFKDVPQDEMRMVVVAEEPSPEKKRTLQSDLGLEEGTANELLNTVYIKGGSESIATNSYRARFDSSTAGISLLVDSTFVRNPKTEQYNGRVVTHIVHYMDPEAPLKEQLSEFASLEPGQMLYEGDNALEETKHAIIATPTGLAALQAEWSA